jgi:hypothetical protein
MRADVAWVPIAGTWARQSRPGVRGDEPAHSEARWHALTPRLHTSQTAARRPGASCTEGWQRGGSRLEQAVPRELHHVRVDLVRVADLSRERARGVFGLPRMNQSQAQWPAFQEVGEQLAAQGAQGILNASAARTRSLCLCVFEAGLTGLSIEGAPLRVLAAPPPPRGLGAQEPVKSGSSAGFTQDHSWMAIAIRTGEQTRQVQMVCLDELVADDDVLRRSHAGDCLQ